MVEVKLSATEPTVSVVFTAVPGVAEAVCCTETVSPLFTVPAAEV